MAHRKPSRTKRQLVDIRCNYHVADGKGRTRPVSFNETVRPQKADTLLRDFLDGDREVQNGNYFSARNGPYGMHIYRVGDQVTYELFDMGKPSTGEPDAGYASGRCSREIVRDAVRRLCGGEFPFAFLKSTSVRFGTDND